MALDNYTDLQASVADWLNRTDLTSAVPDFIRLFEARADRELRTRHQLFMRTMTISSELLPLPCDIRSVLSFRIGSSVNGGKLQYLSPQQMDELSIGASGIPDSYTIVGSKFLFHPAPTAAFQARLRAREAIPHLGVSTPDNWLLAKHPDAYLYGSLLQAAPYLQDDDRVDMWEAALEKVLGEINDEEKGLIEDSLQTRSGVTDHRHWYGRSAGLNSY